MSKSLQIDTIDKRVLQLLIRDSRKPVLEIARDIGVSGAAIHQRLAKLRKRGIITGTHITLSYKELGYSTCAYLGVYLERASEYEKVIFQLKRIPEVIECHYTTGKYSLFLKIIAQDNDHLMRLLTTNIQSISGVSRTETFISLDESIMRTFLPK